MLNSFDLAEFPWVVAIIQKIHDNDNIVNVFKCGGSLIHPSVIMTAAHCVVDLKDHVQDVMTRVGEWDTQTVNEPYPHQDRGVVDILVHPEYTRGSHFNNIALLFLDKPVELDVNINTACLPPQDYKFDHQRCFATGWGKIIFSFAVKSSHIFQFNVILTFVFFYTQITRQRSIWQRWIVSSDFEKNRTASCTE